ncbi:MAG: hypothetical protein CW716_06255 [Candidatus Bathyarchaeum sp.]|nr:MAG: hypothetical protein CW716_06255 [Candidatus Bathyarchaeum sp.]
MNFFCKMKVNVFIFLVFCVFSFTACAVKTPVKQVSISEVKQNLKYENVVFRSFKAAPNVTAPEGPLLECRRSAIGYLEMKSVFKRVEKDSGENYDGPTMFVDATLTSLRIVGGAARFFAGAFAGRSNMNMNIKLTDADGLVIAERELIGAPNALGSAYSFGGTDRSLPQKMGFLLGDFILSNAAEK